VYNLISVELLGFYTFISMHLIMLVIGHTVVLNSVPIHKYKLKVALSNLSLFLNPYD
jgi:uncharacterized membrane protein YjdF